MDGLFEFSYHVSRSVSHILFSIVSSSTPSGDLHGVDIITIVFYILLATPVIIIWLLAPPTRLLC